MIITINEIPPSNNEYMGNSRSFHLYRREKDRWHLLVRAAISERPKEPYKKAAVSLLYFFPDRHRRDPDNYSGKFILDALVREGILADDNFDVITLTVQKGGVDRKQPHTVVEIKEQTND